MLRVSRQAWFLSERDDRDRGFAPSASWKRATLMMHRHSTRASPCMFRGRSSAWLHPIKIAHNLGRPSNLTRFPLLSLFTSSLLVLRASVSLKTTLSLHTHDSGTVQPPSYYANCALTRSAFLIGA